MTDDDKNEDHTIWKYVTKGITPIDRSTAFRPESKRASKRNNANPSSQIDQKSTSEREFNKALQELETDSSKQSPPKNAVSKNKSPLQNKGNGGFDKRTDERLRRGQMPIEALIDLHGYNKEQAKGVLSTFIRAAYGQGKRCVLVITGKGSRNNKTNTIATKGVLRTNVPEWLSELPLSDIVIKHYPAKPKDGGDGALYVYLKRNRSL